MLRWLSGYRTQDNFRNGIVGENIDIVLNIEMLQFCLNWFWPFRHVWRPTEAPIKSGEYTEDKPIVRFRGTEEIFMPNHLM